MTTPDLVGHAQALIDENRYLTLGTISADGRPWTSPVCFAAAGVREFSWVSLSDAQHSRNLSDAQTSVSCCSTPPSRRTTDVLCMRPAMPASCPATRSTQGSRCTRDSAGQA